MHPKDNAEHRPLPPLIVPQGTSVEEAGNMTRMHQGKLEMWIQRRIKDAQRGRERIEAKQLQLEGEETGLVWTLFDAHKAKEWFLSSVESREEEVLMMEEKTRKALRVLDRKQKAGLLEPQAKRIRTLVEWEAESRVAHTALLDIMQQGTCSMRQGHRAWHRR